TLAPRCMDVVCSSQVELQACHVTHANEVGVWLPVLKLLYEPAGYQRAAFSQPCVIGQVGSEPGQGLLPQLFSLPVIDLSRFVALAAGEPCDGAGGVVTVPGLHDGANLGSSLQWDGPRHHRLSPGVVNSMSATCSGPPHRT